MSVIFIYIPPIPSGPSDGERCIKRPKPNNSIKPDPFKRKKTQCLILEPYVRVHVLSASQKNKRNFEAFFILTNKTKLHFNLVLKA